VSRRFDLRELEDRILRKTGNVLERVVGADAEGNVVFEKTGQPNQVRLTRRDLTQLRGVALLTHNHPSGGGIGIGDLDVAVTVDARELNAFSERYRYRLLRPAGGWPALRSMLQELEVIRGRIEARLRARVAAGTLSPENASLRYWHDVWTAFSRAHPEVHYVRENR